MLLREVIFQGVLGCATPVRLKPDSQVAQLTLPAGVSAEDVQDVIVSMFYPQQLNARQKAKVSADQPAKIAAIFEDDANGRFRVVRDGDANTLRLQREESGTFKDLVRGPGEVHQQLTQRFKLPDYGIFLALNLWRFDESAPAPVADLSKFGSDPRIPDLIALYRQAVEVETIEDAVKSLEFEVEGAQKALGDFADVEQKLALAREKLAEIALPDLLPEEIELLRNKDEQLEEFDQQVGRLLAEEDAERRQIELLVPDKPYRNPIFWVGACMAVVAVGVSIASPESLCMASMANVIGAGVAAFVLLQYFNNLGRASVHQVRLESIKRRLNQVREEQIYFLEKIDHALIHAGVDDEQEIHKRVPKVARLREMIVRLEEQYNLLQSNPQHRKARAEADLMVRELKRLQKRRIELPSFVMSSYQLETDLESMGVDPNEVRDGVEEVAKELAQVVEEELTPFQRLRRVAEMTGLWSARGLEVTTQKMWAKICSHVLSERFADVSLSDDGQLHIGSLTAEQLEMWSRTRSSEVRAVIAALALAMQVNADSASAGLFRALWINDPVQELTPAHATKFESVFRSAAKKSQIVICKA
ncbi:MAG: hypothetical protein H0U74_05280 [Bradymonadaceae bacterium]|nr:hypothetical protein [Lujinxingiaceae bacterium]